MLEFLFGKQLTPKERMRRQQRALQTAQRQLRREVTKIEQEEKKLIKEIQASAKKGETDACKVMAKSMVRNRRFIKKFRTMDTNLTALNLRLARLSTNHDMAVAVRDATKAMRAMNAGMNLPGIQKVLMDFERESGVMDMKEEMMEETMDEAMDDEDEEEEESEEIVAKVLDEIGIQLNQTLGSVPTGFAPQNAAAEADALDDDAALQARLENLRKE
ncbi:ESCRT-III subunit protein did4 [Coemansia sp. RSA 2711]|nr:ESCRT-III subunit protein did4 [Coemansia sp. RSA 2711]